jgi:hypothetical protein
MTWSIDVTSNMSANIDVVRSDGFALPSGTAPFTSYMMETHYFNSETSPENFTYNLTSTNGCPNVSTTDYVPLYGGTVNMDVAECVEPTPTPTPTPSPTVTPTPSPTTTVVPLGAGGFHGCSNATTGYTGCYLASEIGIIGVDAVGGVLYAFAITAVLLGLFLIYKWSKGEAV